MGNSKSCRLTPWAFVLCWPLLLATLGWAQSTSDESIADGQPSFVEQASALQEQIGHSIKWIRQLEARRERAEDLVRQVLDWRIEAATLEALDQAHQLAQLVIDEEKAGDDREPFIKTARDILQRIPPKVRQHAGRLVAEQDLKTDVRSLSAVEQIAVETSREQLSKRMLALFKTLMRNLDLSELLGLDTSKEADFLDESLADIAANESVALAIAQQHGKTLDRQIAALPGDPEMAAQLKVNSARLKRLNDSLRQLVDMMAQRDMRVVEYRQQLLAATGTITTDIFDLEVLTGLAQRWLATAGDWITSKLPAIVLNLLLFLLIVWGAFTLSSLTRKLVSRGLNRTPSNLSQLLRRMIISSAGAIVLVMGLLFGLAQLGISVGPLLAGLGIAGFIVGFALQDTLGNFASGMMILFYRPYDVGDFIETNGVLGKVSHMSLVNTTVLTIDNQTLVLPNSKIWGEVIKNVTAQLERRVDMVFGIGYADDISRAEKVLNEILQSHSKVLQDPEPIVRLHTLNESSVDFVVRPWVKTEDYWDVYWDITRAVKMRFDEEGISIPFPQRDIHIYSRDKAAPAVTALVDPEQSPVAPSGSLPSDQSVSED